jgi:hypothetical protein
MTGIMAAAVGVSPNVIYAAGLYGPFGPANFTISSSGTSVGGTSQSINYTWVGYLRPASTGTNTITINSVWDQFAQFDGTTYNFDWGGSPSSVSYLWVGANAISGFTTVNTNATSNNGSATYSPTLTAGINYPVRYNWQASLPYSSNVFGGNPGWTTGNCSFSVNNGSGFYNSTSNGF